jgi:hypothetical protein
MYMDCVYNLYLYFFIFMGKPVPWNYMKSSGSNKLLILRQTHTKSSSSHLHTSSRFCVPCYQICIPWRLTNLKYPQKFLTYLEDNTYCFYCWNQSFELIYENTLFWLVSWTEFFFRSK